MTNEVIVKEEQDRKFNFSKLKLALGTAALTATMLPCAVFAESETANAALLTAAGDAVAKAEANINGVIPIALGLLGIVLGIRIGVNFLRSLLSSAS